MIHRTQAQMTMITINENKVAVIGDIHIGVNKNSDEFFAITKDWMEHLIAELESRKIGTLFVLGDWHHYRDEISVKTLDFSALIMKMIPKSIKVHLLTGNHDCYLRDTSDIHSLITYLSMILSPNAPQRLVKPFQSSLGVAISLMLINPTIFLVISRFKTLNGIHSRFVSMV